MRSSFSSPTNMAHSRISGFGSMSMIRGGQATIAKQSKFMLGDQTGLDFQKLFGNAITQKDIADIKRMNYVYRRYQNGDVYLGQVDGNDKPQGQGIYIFNNPTSRSQFFYKGTFQQGEFNGFGKICKTINDKQGMYIYQGYWKHSKKQGQGRENYNIQNNFYYRGGFINDQRHGVGTLVMPEGTYEGKWEYGQMNGQGVMTLQKDSIKSVISGKWTNDQINQGAINYYAMPRNQLKGIYKGQIKNLYRNGQGQYQIDKLTIQGNFVNDNLVGNSTLRKTQPQNNYLIQGDFNQTREFDATIKYFMYPQQQQHDHYQGKVQIAPNSHVIRRTKGKYYFSDGSSVQGQFEDNSNGDIIYKNKR